ncbi:hypothetical protein HY570_00650 [Candidatus Micrarchaeota archaeon]|nr:hypothetical protein [Candidatus Micrarchaeota archaeon]
MPQQLTQPFNRDQKISDFFYGLEGMATSYYQNASSRRINDFLHWIRANKFVLMREFREYIKGGNVVGNVNDETTLNTVIAFWLGVKYSIYIGSRFTDKPPINSVPKVYVSKGNSIHAAFNTELRLEELSNPRFSLTVLNLSSPPVLKELRKLSDSFSLLLAVFNAGLHEGTHSLGYIYTGKSTLNEFATSYMQRICGLPMRERDIYSNLTGLISGSRDVITLINLYETRNPMGKGRVYRAEHLRALREYSYEYIEHLLAPWMVPRIGKEINIFQMKDNRSKEQEYSSNIGGLMQLAFYLSRANPETDQIPYFSSFEQMARQYCTSLSITDPVLIKKVETAFKWIAYYFVKHPHATRNNGEFAAFLSELRDKFNEIFGKPETIDIPKGYAQYLENITPRRIS